MANERRCPNCGALVSEDAEWCGQCFTSLREPEPEPAPSVPHAAKTAATLTEVVGSDATAESPRQEAFWPCTVCGAHNLIAFDVCETCGTPFATVMRGTAQPDVDPKVARTRSILFPGAGHAALGYPIDGFARGAVFTLSLGLAIFLAITVPRSAPMLLAITLLVGTAVGVYVLSLTETQQLSERRGLLIPSRYLLWGAVGLMFISVAMIALAIAGNTRR
jgi:ribosomal protein L40E